MVQREPLTDAESYGRKQLVTNSIEEYLNPMELTESLSEPTSDDHGEIRFYLDLTYHIYADHSPTSELGNHGLPMRNLSTGGQTIATLPIKVTFFNPFKLPPPGSMEINHCIPGSQGQRTRGWGWIKLNH